LGDFEFYGVSLVFWGTSGILFDFGVFLRFVVFGFGIMLFLNGFTFVIGL